MGKTRTGFKNEAREKVPLDQQITAGKVVRGSKDKFKLRLRAEEEDVSFRVIHSQIQENTRFLENKSLFLMTFL